MALGLLTSILENEPVNPCIIPLALISPDAVKFPSTKPSPVLIPVCLKVSNVVDILDEAVV